MSSFYTVYVYCGAQAPSVQLPRLKQTTSLGRFKLLSLIVLLINMLIETPVITNALASLYSFDVFRKLALRFTSPPDWEVAFEDVVDLFQSTSGGFGVREEDVEGHCCA